VLAVIGSNLGFLFLDPLVAVIETVDLMYLSLRMLKEALQGTLDSAADPEVTGADRIRCPVWSPGTPGE